MDFPRVWVCEQCGNSNYCTERNDETFIQCQQCKHEINVEHIEFEFVFWRCCKCKHENDPTETITERDEMAFAKCHSCGFEERILIVI